MAIALKPVVIYLISFCILIDNSSSYDLAKCEFSLTDAQTRQKKKKKKKKKSEIMKLNRVKYFDNFSCTD